MNKFIVCVLIFLKVVNICSQKCKYVRDLEVSYFDEQQTTKNENFHYTLMTSSCISNATFDVEKVFKLSFFCKAQNLPVLEKNFVNNMDSLQSLYVGKCFLQRIEPGAFFNLPQLKMLSIYGNPLTKIAEGVFNVLPSLQTLHIFKNEISEVEDNSFSNLPNLKSFSLSENNLTHIKREWFTNTSNMNVVRFFQNSIRTVPTGMFHGWKKLKELDLSANYISTIKGPLIKDNAPYMNILGLHRNLLTTVSLEMFSNTTFIGYLMVSGNLLNYLPEDFMRNLRVTELSIFANPFTCPCYNKIYKILYERKIIINDVTRLTNKACLNSDVPACGFSRNVTDTCVEVVDKELTKRIISHMKKVRYDTVVDYSGQQCASFSYIDE